jgi:hypothetical protein
MPHDFRDYYIDFLLNQCNIEVQGDCVVFSIVSRFDYDSVRGRKIRVGVREQDTYWQLLRRYATKRNR